MDDRCELINVGDTESEVMTGINSENPLQSRSQDTQSHTQYTDLDKPSQSQSQDLETRSHQTEDTNSDNLLQPQN